MKTVPAFTMASLASFVICAFSGSYWSQNSAVQVPKRRNSVDGGEEPLTTLLMMRCTTAFGNSSASSIVTYPSAAQSH